MIHSTSIAIFNEVAHLIESLKKTPREHPLEWEYLHASSTAQIGRMLAIKRGIDTDIAAIACYLHDIGRIMTGKQEGHAAAGEIPTKEILSRFAITGEIANDITASVVHHSLKEEKGSPLEELVKDADVIDCALYGIFFNKEGFMRRLSYCQKEIGIIIRQPK